MELDSGGALHRSRYIISGSILVKTKKEGTATRGYRFCIRFYNRFCFLIIFKVVTLTACWKCPGDKWDEQNENMNLKYELDC